MKLYVGNLSYDTTEDELKEAFEAHDEVDSVAIISDRHSGRSKGFGFVEMSDDTEAKAAMKSIDETEFMGRKLKVNKARSRD